MFEGVEKNSLIGSSPEILRLDVEAQNYARRSRADHTAAAYSQDWRSWLKFCAAHGVSTLTEDPRDVCRWLVWMAGRKPKGLRPSTIARRLSGLRFKLVQKVGVVNAAMDVDVGVVLEGIRRTHGVAPLTRKRALSKRDVFEMVPALPRRRAVDVRNAALILLLFVTGARGAEVVNLDRSDVEFVPGGMKIRFRKSKTDQLGQGRLVGVHCAAKKGQCPVAALKAWMGLLPDEAVGVFTAIHAKGKVSGRRIGTKQVRGIVKKLAARAAIPSSEIGTHSLRAGFYSASARAKFPDSSIMRRGGWRSAQVASNYNRDAGELDKDWAEALVI